MSTSRDRQILNSIINPLLPIGEAVYDPDENTDDNQQQPEVESEQTTLSKAFEKEAILASDKGDIDASLQLFTKAIEAEPNRASCYNNRAQAHRLKGQIGCALNDIETAISISQGKGKAAKQAYVQRGLINRRNGNDDKAKEDFEKAADLGSDFAKAVLVEMNPFAALCNKMLKDVYANLLKENE